MSVVKHETSNRHETSSFTKGNTYMATEDHIDSFLSQYDEKVYENAQKLRKIIFTNLPNVIEQIDIPAKMIAYCYGQKYSELICVLIPSKKGLKLGFNRGTELPDPEGILEGNGKISRYVQIKTDEQISSNTIKQLLENALALYNANRQPPNN